jgi:hypothetical protein
MISLSVIFFVPAIAGSVCHDVPGGKYICIVRRFGGKLGMGGILIVQQIFLSCPHLNGQRYEINMLCGGVSLFMLIRPNNGEVLHVGTEPEKGCGKLITSDFSRPVMHFCR